MKGNSINLIFIVLFLTLSGLLNPLYAQQDQDIKLGGSTIVPAPAVVGGSVKMCFIFDASTGITLNPGEEFSMAVGFAKISPESIQNSTITMNVGSNLQNAISWTYLPATRNWIGLINSDVPSGMESDGEICFDNLIVSEPATPAEADNGGGVSIFVDLTPHHRDPSGNEPNDETYNATYTIEASDLAVTKVVNNSSPAVGEDVVFTITATNNGPSPATGVRVVDALPSGYTFVNASASPGSWSSSSNSWTIGSLAVGASVTMQLTANVLPAGSYLNTATITGNETDTNPDNNTDTETVTPVTSSADLSVTKVVNNSNPAIGEQVVFTITATNNGPQGATGVRVEDILPSGYTLMGANSSGSTTWLAPNWNIGSLANGQSATLTILATVNGSGSYANTATITGIETDPNPGNNTDTETVTPSAASVDLAVVKSVNIPVATVGQEVIFTITATNYGPQTATGVRVEDILPTGYTFMGETASSGTTWVSPNWTIGTLANGASATLQIRAVVRESGVYLNTATITGNEPDSNPSNNTDNDQVTIQGECTQVVAGSTLTAIHSGNNTQAGYTTTYVLTNASGIIQSTSAAPQFTAPSVEGEYRIYAVNYSGVAPSLTNGTNINSVEGSVDCADVSDNYKCFVVISCPPPTVSLQSGSSATICAGGSTTLVAQGCTGTVTWFAGGVATGQTGNTITVNPTNTTNYTATCTSAGCGTTAQSTSPVVVTVTQPVTPTNVSASLLSVTLGQSTTLQATCSSGSPVWRDAQNVVVNSTVTPPTLGTHTYTVTCGDGACFLPATVTITVQDCPPPTVSIQTGSSATICVGGNTTLAAQGCTGTVTWFAAGVSTGQTGNTIIVNPASTTSYTATCTSTVCGTTVQSTSPVVVTVTQPILPTGVIPNVNVSYSQANVTLTATCSNGTYIWKNGGGTVVSTVANPSIPVSSGTTTYTVACGEGSCFTPVSVTVFKCSNPENNCLSVSARKL